MNFINTLIQNWNSFDIKVGIAIFFAYLVVDALYAQYTFNITRFKAYSSATIGALMYLIIAFGVLNYVNNFLYIIPLVVGSWTGTFIVVNRERKKNINKSQ